MWYRFIQKLLFLLDAETSHTVTLETLRYLQHSGILAKFKRHYHAPHRLFNIDFPNPVGLAAGLDKNGDYLSVLQNFGFGFIELGTVTPRAQSGNPRPRLFRLAEQRALINRMGFNNKGVDYLVERVKQSRYDGVLGVNIGKNATTPLANAVEDYRYCLQLVYDIAHYVVINISSPNTVGLRELQQGTQFIELLTELKKTQQQLWQRTKKYTPLLIKVAPDLTAEQIEFMAKQLLYYEIDGLIATNTTQQRLLLPDIPLAKEEGGLSGTPLLTLSNQVLQHFRQALGKQFPIIGVGGILSAADALTKKQAGADLLQIYSGFIYTGPSLIAAIIKHGYIN